MATTDPKNTNSDNADATNAEAQEYVPTEAELAELDTLSSTSTESSDLSYLDTPSEPSTDTAQQAQVTDFESEPAAVVPAEPAVPDKKKEAKEHAASLHEANKIPMGKLVRIWSAIILSIALLVFLIIFLAQNQDMVTIKFLGFSGELNLGLMLFIAALAGGLIVAIIVAARVIKIRANARKERKAQIKALKNQR